MNSYTEHGRSMWNSGLVVEVRSYCQRNWTGGFGKQRIPLYTVKYPGIWPPASLLYTKSIISMNISRQLSAEELFLIKLDKSRVRSSIRALCTALRSVSTTSSCHRPSQFPATLVAVVTGGAIKVAYDDESTWALSGRSQSLSPRYPDILWGFWYGEQQEEVYNTE